MADALTTGLTGLAAILSGIAKRKTRETEEKVEKSKIKLREQQAIAAAEKAAASKAQAALATATQAAIKRKREAEAREAEAGAAQAAQTTDIRSRLARVGRAPAGGLVGPPHQDPSQQQVNVDELGLLGSEFITPKAQSPAQEEASAASVALAKMRAEKEGAVAQREAATTGLLTGRAGGNKPVLTQIGPGGPTFAFPQAKGEVTEADQRARQRVKLDDAAIERAPMNQIMTELDSLASGLITAKTPGDAWQQWARLTVGAFTRRNVDATIYKDMSKALLRLIARQFGEKGVITDRDIADFEGMLPKFNDTVAMKEKRMNIINRILQAKVEAAQLVTGDTKVTDVKSMSDEELLR